MDKKPVTVGSKEGLGAGIIAIGLMLFFHAQYGTEDC